MNNILLSGGSGARLWPLSNDVRSKQFLKIFESEHGKESMLQRIYKGVKAVNQNGNIVIATSENQVSQIKAQIGEDVVISIEPTRRDTFPAIALACALLAKNGTSIDDTVVVCPVDSFVNKDYFDCLETMSQKALQYNLVLLGIQPTEPSEKYGYISVKDDEVVGFKEKPNIEKAKEYISSGALWNGGVFAFKLGYVLKIAKNEFGYSDYQSLYDNYDQLTKISFDYAIVEKEACIGVVKYDGAWKDLGTWDALSDAVENKANGNVIVDNCDSTYVLNELSIPAVVLGVDNAVIAATPDGILVADKKDAQKLKDYIKPQRPMYEARQWGEYKVLDYCIQPDGHNSMTKHLVIKSGQHISYQYHNHRTEMWTVTDGIGTLIIDDKVQKVVRGDSITIPTGTKHAIKGETELHIIEVQIGDILTEEDIVRLDYDWDRL